MGIRFTKATKQILEFITEHHFITAKICANIFYKEKKNPLVQSQVKLRNLYNDGIVKRYENTFSKEYVYTYDGKTISEHQLYVMNLYSYLYNNFEIIYFKIEPSWSYCKRRNDAHIIFKKADGTTIGILAEVDLFHITSQSKLDELYKSEEVQQFYENNYEVKGYYPSIVIINATGNTQIKSNEYDIVCCDYDFNGLAELL